MSNSKYLELEYCLNDSQVLEGGMLSLLGIGPGTGPVDTGVPVAPTVVAPTVVPPATGPGLNVAPAATGVESNNVLPTREIAGTNTLTNSNSLDLSYLRSSAPIATGPGSENLVGGNFVQNKHIKQLQNKIDTLEKRMQDLEDQLKGMN